MKELGGLPAVERILRGLEDSVAGKTTVDALLVAVASKRLAALGLPVPGDGARAREAELELYELLCSGPADDPYFAYRAALDELDSFLSALEAHSRTAARPVRLVGS